MTVENFTTAGDFVWPAPVGVVSVVVETWGEAGSGGDGGDGAAGGGGGGAYAKKTITTTPGNNYNGHVGTANLQEGSWFVDATTVYAAFGNTATGTSGAQGGLAGDCVGEVVRSGGNGGNTGTTGGGGGGSSAGPSGDGNNGANGAVASGGAGGAAVTDGGAGGAGGNATASGSAGTQPGGAGGGGGNLGSAGTGANGKVRLTYTAASSGPPLGTCGMMGAGR